MSQKKEENNKQRMIHICIILGIVVLILAVAGVIILKYQVEGEKNLPFQLTKLIVVSTAEGYKKTEPAMKWDLDIDQNNDFYLAIEKNKEYKSSEIIKKVSLENFQVTGGNMAIYRPADSGLYKREDKYKVENSLVYQGDKQSNINELKIANQGGVLLFRYANQNIAAYQSQEDVEIVHDGLLLQKTGTLMEQIKTTLSFDLIIETANRVKYKASISLEVPVGNISGEGTCTFEKTDFSDVIFKRI